MRIKIPVNILTNVVMTLNAAVACIPHQQKKKLPVGGCAPSYCFILHCSSPDVGPVRGISGCCLQLVCWCCCYPCQTIILENWVGGDSHTAAVTLISTNSRINGPYCIRSTTTTNIWSTLFSNIVVLVLSDSEQMLLLPEINGYYGICLKLFSVFPVLDMKRWMVKGFCSICSM